MTLPTTTARRCCAIESLESRTLLAFTAEINFQPGNAATPAGYKADVGYVYGSRGDGLVYGWDQNNTQQTRDRNDSRSPDQRYDTLNLMQRNGNRKWEMAVPNGTYKVRVVAGDPSNYSGIYYSVDVEGIRAIDAAPTSQNRWVERIASVVVSDGRLTISNGTGAKNSKISFVQIQQVTAPADFIVLDAMSFTNEPDLTAMGLQPIYVTSLDMWKGTYPNYDTSKPDEAACRALARKVAAMGVRLVVDIEHWPTDIRFASKAEVEASIAKFKQIAEWIHDEEPAVKLGFYGVMPNRDYWTPVNYLTALERPNEPWYAANLEKFTQAYVAWQEANAFVAARLADDIDFICPSIYTFYDDRGGWQKYADANIAEAAKPGRPVYPFLMPHYHDSNKQLGGTNIDPLYWRQQLDTTEQSTAGVVIWGGWQKNWDLAAGWWQTTADFMVSL